MPKHSSVKVAKEARRKYRMRLKKVKCLIRREILQELESIFVDLSQGQDELRLFSEYVGNTKKLSEQTLQQYLTYISNLSHYMVSSRGVLISVLSGASQQETETGE